MENIVHVQWIGSVDGLTNEEIKKNAIKKILDEGYWEINDESV